MVEYAGRQDTHRTPNPGRNLHEAAEELLDELTERYAVDRRETKEPAGEPLRTVRLVPRHPAAGPLAVIFTDGPGVVLRLGRWFTEPLPGTDDVREAPELVAYLRALAAAHVEGGLWERIRRGLSGSCIETRLIGAGLESARQAPVDNAEARSARREGFAAPVQWAPWPRRAA
ncbi:DUF6226 family protein [Actinoplanes sp. RD1]|uniref:DUF6226 family protein n=1 Tax=Actinoplanes sp. RD1 TaxID=3064538 RepID=UPI00274110F9|nr:DUF6226 family protein [Actinoplanes sp. RD1]